MSVLQSSLSSLHCVISAAATGRRGFIADDRLNVPLARLAGRTSLGGRLEKLRGRSVLLRTERQINAAVAAAEIDGLARRMVLVTPDASDAHIRAAMLDAEVDAVVLDEGTSKEGLWCELDIVACSGRLQSVGSEIERNVLTEWVLMTSGTTGPPKLAVHSLKSLVAPMRDGLCPENAVWSTFYDIRRYGGLQVLLRSLVGGGSMVLSDAGEPTDRFLGRAGVSGVTHMSGTPSHWRGALMSNAVNDITPAYVRLSGEVCDQPILNRLRCAYPNSSIAHAFASTEAGVAFDVGDGLAGFPASLVRSEDTDVEMRVEDGSLRVRSSRMASRYLGQAQAKPLSDLHGFIDTGDLLDLRDGRYFFAGRRGGVINVGGLKVHPEVVEAVINEHPAVHTSRVSGRSSPITGALVVAEIVMKQTVPSAAKSFAIVRRELLELCQSRLPRHQVPATFRRASSLDVAASGKMTRLHA